MKPGARCGLVALILIAGPLAAQRRSAYWVALGAGRGSISGGGSVALYASYNYQRGANLFTVRGTGVVDVLGALFNGFTGKGANTAASEIGLLYGRALRPGRAFVAVSAGIGLAQVTRDSAGTSHRTYRPSLPLEAQLALRPAPFLGLMVLGFANLNKRQSFSGITAGVQLGGLY
jgi:hypothetical protein